MEPNSSSESIRRLYEVAADRNVDDLTRYTAEIQLFDIACSDSEEALNYLRKLSLDAARGALMRWIPDYADAEDFPAQGFENAWESRGKFRKESKFSTLAATCARNRFKDWLVDNTIPTTVFNAFKRAVGELTKHDPVQGECFIRRYLAEKKYRTLKAIAKEMKITEAKSLDILAEGWEWLLQGTDFRDVLVKDPDGCVRTFINSREGSSIQALRLVFEEDKSGPEIATTLDCTLQKVRSLLYDACDTLLQEFTFRRTRIFVVDLAPLINIPAPGRPEEIGDILTGLKEPHRTTLALFFIEGMSEREVQWHCSIRFKRFIPLGTLRRWKNEGLQRLGHLMRNDQNDERAGGTTVRLFVRPENRVRVEPTAVIVHVHITVGDRVLPPVKFNMTLDSDKVGGPVNERIYLPAGMERLIAAEVFSKGVSGSIQGTLLPTDPDGDVEIFSSPLYGDLKINLPPRQEIDAVVRVAPRLDHKIEGQPC